MQFRRDKDRLVAEARLPLTQQALTLLHLEFTREATLHALKELNIGSVNFTVHNRVLVNKLSDVSANGHAAHTVTVHVGPITLTYVLVLVNRTASRVLAAIGGRVSRQGNSIPV